ncbi:ferritin-like domain-containing protein [Pedobacter sp.]|jgi:hypothetical protein|uniref:ferritin-like domain-containing protein n=1 Tax=Pedobacter sp. TaxID=1411316 RepID=UPI002C7E91B3|nr:ferritin-like domain-containing protein [Pedobacter sp.]HWW40481.1 ferritin-like domain-containing protein [Pedobacter sp.]
MNIVNIIEEIEKVDGEIYERLSPRRSAMKDFYNMGKKVALAAMPMALGSMFTKAYGQSTPSDVTATLNFALTLEYLEYHFYNHAVANASAIALSGAALTAITTIRDHEKAHVALLAGALGSAAIPVKAYTDFDYTAKGTFPNVFSDYGTFLAVAQAFEDTGVRAYKGQATVLKGNAVLTTALQIHSVEARHAAHIRYMRAASGVSIKPWISLGPGGSSNDSGVPAADPVYAGENNTSQANINIVGINGNTGITAAAAAECFDEPLAKADVLTIAGLFIK